MGLVDMKNRTEKREEGDRSTVLSIVYMTRGQRGLTGSCLRLSTTIAPKYPQKAPVPTPSKNRTASIKNPMPPFDAHQRRIWKWAGDSANSA